MKAFPRNIDVALKLLEVALENEGDGYWERLRRMRASALELMKALEEFNPRLVGSVWRGIVKPDSDIDIELDYDDPGPVTSKLTEKGFAVKGVERLDLPDHLRDGSVAKVKVDLGDGLEAEIVLKEHQAYLNPPRCDIFGDVRKGLTLAELKRLMENEPTRLFLPGKKPWR